jgi:hypothetical protein
MLEYRLPSASHVDKNRLSKMPPEKLIYWSLRIIKQSLIKMLPSNILAIKAKVHNFVTILK